MYLYLCCRLATVTISILVYVGTDYIGEREVQICTIKIFMLLFMLLCGNLIEVLGTVDEM